MTEGDLMKSRKILEYRLSNGRGVFAIVDSKRWFIELSKNELPYEVKNRIEEEIKDAKIKKELIA